MKTLNQFLSAKPSYTKCSAEAIAKASGLAVSTVKRFMRTNAFSELRTNYRKNIR